MLKKAFRILTCQTNAKESPDLRSNYSKSNSNFSRSSYSTSATSKSNKSETSRQTTSSSVPEKYTYSRATTSGRSTTRQGVPLRVYSTTPYKSTIRAKPVVKYPPEVYYKPSTRYPVYTSRGKVVRKTVTISMADRSYRSVTATECFSIMNDFKERNEILYIYFYGSRNAAGVSWCGDTVAADPVMKEGLKYMPENGVFVEVDVGTRDEWKRSNHPFRNDPRLKLTGIPTLLRVDTGERLVEGDLYYLENIRDYFART